MIITNKLNLPQAFVEMAKSDYKLAENEYRVTSLLKGLRETILERRYHNKIEQDVSDMIWLLFGTAVHGVLENHKEADHEIKEERLKIKIGDYILSGQFDLYNAKTGVVSDYKTCSVWKVIFGDYEDWRRQLLIYAYMLRSIGFPVKGGEVIALMKDHSKAQAKRKADYPEHPVKKITFTFNEKDFKDIEKWLKERFTLIAALEKLPDDKLPLCTLEERFNSGGKWAVMNGKNKRAVRVLDSQEEAEKHLSTGKGTHIEHRPGEDKKCQDYCSVSEFCSYWKEKSKEVAI